jgi:hypothetical protein
MKYAKELIKASMNGKKKDKLALVSCFGFVFGYDYTRRVRYGSVKILNKFI